MTLLDPVWLRIGGYWYPRGGMPIDVFWQTGAPPDGAWDPAAGRGAVPWPRLTHMPDGVVVDRIAAAFGPYAELAAHLFAVLDQDDPPAAGFGWLARSVAHPACMAQRRSHCSQRTRLRRRASRCGSDPA